MLKKELLELWYIFNSLYDIKSTKFSYFILKNINIIKNDIEILRKLSSPSEKFNEFQSKRLDLCKKFADKDENNNHVIQNNQYIIKKNREEFDKKFKELKLEYNDIIKEQEKKDNEFKHILEEKIENKIDFYKIKFEDLPDNLTAKQIEKLDNLIIYQENK